MREFSVAPLVEPARSGGLADSVFECAVEEPGVVAFGRKVDGGWRDVSAAEFAGQVLALAKGLVASGVEVGDRVGIMSRTVYEWTLFDYALWAIGAVGVPVYPTSSAEQVAWMLGDAAAVACVVESDDHAAVVAQARDQLPGLRHVWQIDTGAVATLCEAPSALAVGDAEIERRRATVDPATPATVIYTSGTTGRPKGCVLTHGNFMAEVDNAVELLDPVFRAKVDDPPSTLLFLPLAHVFGRMIQVGCQRARVKLSHAPSLAQHDLLTDLAAVAPTFVLGVPYVFEKVFNTGRATAEKIGRASSFDRAVSIAVKYAEAVERRELAGGSGPGPGLKLRAVHALYDKLVYTRVRQALGGKVKYAISGGSPLGRRTALFFSGAGVTVFEGYGLTETTAAITVNPPDRPKFGTVGQPLPGTTIRIAEDGEIEVSGGQVFRRYWNNETATKEAVDDGPDGIWFATGDLGELDDEGYLTITGRKKDIIVTSGGKNVVPALLEDVVRAHPLVSQCLVVGDNRSFVAALVTIDPDTVDHWKAMNDKPADATVRELRSDADLLAEIGRAVAAANDTVSKAESIRSFHVLDVDFTEDNGLLTPSLKVKRSVIVEAFSAEIEQIYTKKAQR